jgi:hypothetical protein
MTKELGQHFINLRDILNANPPPNGRIGYEFGASPISVVLKEQSKPARRADRHLLGTIKAGIFGPDIITGEPALVHDLNNSTYIRVVNGDGQEWFVHPRILVQKNGKVDYANEFPLQDVQERLKAGVLNIVSGICLFGTSGASVIDKDGNKFSLTDPTEVDAIQTTIAKVEIHKGLHPYEADSILRLTSFLGSLNSSIPAELSFHIPRLEYWLYGLSLYEKGLMASDTLLNWFNEVNQRSIPMETMVRKRMPANVRMNVVSPLEYVENLIVEAVRSGTHGIQGNIIKILEASNSLWQSMLAVSSQAQTDLLELNYQSYVHAYLDVLRRGNGLMVAVENPEEANILENAKKAIGLGVKDLKQPGIIIGLFVHPYMLVPEGTAKGGKKVLYFSEDLSSDGIKEIIHSHR